MRELRGSFWSWQWLGWCAAAPWAVYLHPWCCARAGLEAGSCRCCLGGCCTPWGPASMSHPGARDGTRCQWEACSHPPPAPTGRYPTPSSQRTTTKQVAKKWCCCVMSNLCIIKILFEQMSQEASGPVSQAGAAKFFCPSVGELGVLVLLALAGIAAMVREPCLPVGTEGRVVLSSLVGMWLRSRWFCVRGRRRLWEVRRQPFRAVPCSSSAGGFQGHLLLLSMCSRELSGGLRGAGRVAGVLRHRELWLPMCISERGQVLVPEAAAGCPGMWHHGARWLLIPAAAAPHSVPKGRTMSGVFRAVTPKQSYRAQLCVEL